MVQSFSYIDIQTWVDKLQSDFIQIYVWNDTFY
jgi:hypothetical protein